MMEEYLVVYLLPRQLSGGDKLGAGRHLERVLLLRDFRDLLNRNRANESQLTNQNVDDTAEHGQLLYSVDEIL